MNIPALTGLPSLSDCAREPIHIPGAIQPHGCLFAVNRDSLLVEQVSANVESCLGFAPAAVLGRHVVEILGNHQADLLRDIVARSSQADANLLHFEFHGTQFDAIVHMSEETVILELEPTEASSGTLLQTGLDQTLRQLARCDDFDQLVDVTARTVRALTGFDRVMVYRFDSDGHGEVIAEAKAEEMEAFLGLHYPESDIPRQAREMYLRGWVRCIPDALYAPVALMRLFEPVAGKPLDLSQSILRSVSPVHLEYMANMGVRASMSVSLIVAGRLWGLISCAHRSPHFVPSQLRSACETIGRVVSLQLGALGVLDFRRRQEEKVDFIRKLVASMQGAGDEVLEGLAGETESLLAIAGAAGAAILSGKKVALLGSCPPESVVLALSRWICSRTLEDGSFHSHSLAEHGAQWLPWADRASGIVAVVLPGASQRCVIWFRPGLTQTVNWGGNPDKAGQVQYLDGVPRLHPRRSFELWKQVVRSRSLRWNAAELHAVAELRRRALEVDLVRQIAREQAAVHARDDLVGVVSHDLRTPIAIVVMQTVLIQRLLAKNSPDLLDRLRVSADTIHRTGLRMSTLLDDLLDLAKIEAGRFPITPVPCQATRLVEEACELMATLAQSASIEIVVEHSADVCVTSDPGRIFQLFSNLIGNAIKHAVDGDQVRVGSALANGMCEFWVSDDGPGILPEHMGNIFDRYWQGKQSNSVGAGLGLYIAKGIVEAHGGTLRAHSIPGAGATFVFTLPLQ